MDKIESNNNDAAANVKIDCSYIMIEPIVPPSHRRENQNHNKRHFNDDSLSKSTRNEFEAEQSIRRRRRRDDKLADQIVERLEKKMDQKMRNLETEINQKMEQISGQVSKLTKSVDFILNNVVNRQSKRDGSRSDESRSSSRSSKRRRVSRSRSISRSQESEIDQQHYRNNGMKSQSQEREPTAAAAAAESSNFIDNETLARLRKKYSTPTAFARNLMPKLFTMDEMTVKNVNVEGRSMNGAIEPAVGLSPRRVGELKINCLQNVPANKRESVWRDCRHACNTKLWQLREKNEENNNASRSGEREPQNHHHNNGEREREQIAAESSNLIDNETIASLRKLHPTPKAFARNLMLKLFTLDEMTLENVNVEGRMISGSLVPAVGLSPRRVAELKRHCLENVAINERESVWRDCRHLCNKKLNKLKQMNAKKICEKMNQKKYYLKECFVKLNQI